MTFITTRQKLDIVKKRGYCLQTQDGPRYGIETNDVYGDFYKNQDVFDYREYPENSKFYDVANKKNTNIWI